MEEDDCSEHEEVDRDQDIFLSQYAGRGAEGVVEYNPLAKLRLLYPLAHNRLNRIPLMSELYDLVKAVEDTMDKFSEVLLVEGIEKKVAILEATCGVCNFFENIHSACVYGPQCRTNLQDIDIQLEEDADRIAYIQLAFCDLLREAIYQQMDEVPDNVRLKYSPPFSDCRKTVMEAERDSRKEVRLRLIEKKYGRR